MRASSGGVQILSCLNLWWAFAVYGTWLPFSLPFVMTRGNGNSSHLPHMYRPVFDVGFRTLLRLQPTPQPEAYLSGPTSRTKDAEFDHF